MDDTTPPPVPQVLRAIAFEHGTAAARVIDNHNAGSVPRRGTDPLYFELGNYEPGTAFEIVNRSQNPGTSFQSKDEVVRLEPTGRDIHGRRASVYLNTEQMKKLDLQPGDQLLLRAVDASGNASAPVGVIIDPNSWANQRVHDVINGQNEWTRGTTVGFLDGDGGNKARVIKAVNDTRPPVVSEKSITLEKADAGATMKMPAVAMEPGVNVSVRNLRTGATVGAATADGKEFALSLADVKNGDSLMVSFTDRHGVAAKPLEFRFDPSCEGGKAPLLNILSARFPGAIP